MSTQEIVKAKVILVGESGVGKTCILNKYINNEFDNNSSSTEGVSYAGKVIEMSPTKKIMLEIWDIEGSERRYRTLLKLIMKSSAMTIFVYSQFSRYSFESLNIYLNYMKEVASKNSLYIVAESNKDVTDIVPGVFREEGQEYAQSIGAKFFSISSKTGEGINEMFQEYILFYQGLSKKYIST